MWRCIFDMYFWSWCKFRDLKKLCEVKVLYYIYIISIAIFILLSGQNFLNSLLIYVHFIFTTQIRIEGERERDR